MTSRAGVMITQLMESNIFTGQTGLFDVASVIRYIDNPEGFIKTLNNETLKPNWVIGLGWSHAMFIIVLEKLYGK